MYHGERVVAVHDLYGEVLDWPIKLASEVVEVEDPDYTTGLTGLSRLERVSEDLSALILDCVSLGPQGVQLADTLGLKPPYTGLRLAQTLVLATTKRPH